ncbi:MAG: SH3 domain-containing protein [Pontiellaceae bacterium]|nr:SH3 domain-containing protein [Pontiellaceae bacterium]
MKRFVWMFAMASAVSAAVAQTNKTSVVQSNNVLKVVVTGDRVSLRAAPSLNGDLLDRAMRGDELIYLSETNGWAGVQAPKTLDVWVLGEFIQDDAVLPEKLNVRSGPSLNYPVVAAVRKGDKVEIRSEFNGWVKIVPPEPCLVWISADYVERINPPVEESTPEEIAEVPEENPELKPAPEEETPDEGVEKKPEEEKLPPLLLEIDGSRVQQTMVTVYGVLRRANPGLYQLVLIEDEWEEPVCLIRGSEAQKEELEKLLDHTLRVKGRRFWLKSTYLPLIQPSEIFVDPLIVD